MCSLLVTTAIAEANDKGIPLYISFIDSSKTFDMVDNTILMTSLHDLNLDPHLWHLYKDMYVRVMSLVRIGGQLSKCTEEGRGTHHVH